MNNIIFKTSNGLTMVRSYPLNWRKESVYSNNKSPYCYSINIGNWSDLYTCIYIEETNELTITYSSSPPLLFKVNSIEDAGEIVLKLNNGCNFDLTDTIYYSLVDKRDYKIKQILNIE